MSAPRVALAVNDARLASALQAHLTALLGHPAVSCRMDEVRDHVGPRGDYLLLAAATPADADALARLVREAHLLQLPSPVAVLERFPDTTNGPLGQLNGHLALRLSWPAEADTLSRIVREQTRGRHGGRGGGASAPDGSGTGETVADVLRRRLLAFTPSLLPILDRITLAALHDVTVLLTGETGTGKTHLARLLHECSPRRGEPFLAVPCGAQPVHLVESVFFGHVKGAFTSADRAREGKFAAAGRGTLLLDEIDTLPLDAQASLLKVIETGEYEPVGSNETLHCQARLVVASNWDLEEATRSGKFRPDLYYRLNVLSFHLPPLRERAQDVAPLARGLTARFAAKFGRSLYDIRPEALAALENFDWPGNIRQLENVLQQAVLVCQGPELTLADLPALVRDARPPEQRPPGGALHSSRENTERSVIQQVLRSNNYCRTRTARSLGISRVTLYKKMKKYGLSERPPPSLSQP